MRLKQIKKPKLGKLKQLNDLKSTIAEQDKSNKEKIETAIKEASTKVPTLKDKELKLNADKQEKRNVC
ncbi:hypothetical protein HYE05_03955 [Mycoplasmopsis bovis]|nr:hypothetical protein [Mycoplasmopsis bovis]QQH27673.1 hypothetical protein HYE05_03955 [Mycoplasmopsis bovis]